MSRRYQLTSETCLRSYLPSLSNLSEADSAGTERFGDSVIRVERRRTFFSQVRRPPSYQSGDLKAKRAEK